MVAGQVGAATASWKLSSSARDIPITRLRALEARAVTYCRQSRRYRALLAYVGDSGCECGRHDHYKRLTDKRRSGASGILHVSRGSRNMGFAIPVRLTVNENSRLAELPGHDAAEVESWGSMGRHVRNNFVYEQPAMGHRL